MLSVPDPLIHDTEGAPRSGRRTQGLNAKAVSHGPSPEPIATGHDANAVRRTPRKRDEARSQLEDERRRRAEAETDLTLQTEAYETDFAAVRSASGSAKRY